MGNIVARIVGTERLLGWDDCLGKRGDVIVWLKETKVVG